MSLYDQKLDEILQSLKRIEKKLKITPFQDKDGTITDFDSSIIEYEKFAKSELGLEDNTLENHRSAILGFLNHCGGTITKDTVKAYLDSNNSDSWKSNQVKALRKYIRNFLKLGSWIEEFKFAKASAKIKQIPTDEQLARFCVSLPSYQMQIVFLILHNSGLRLGEVLSLRFKDVDLDEGMINASEIHKGETKSSWVSFITRQTADYLDNYTLTDDFQADESDYGNSRFFSVSARSVQQAFKEISEMLGITLNPHLLRTVFAEKCAKAGIKDKYINAFCGRVSKGILAKNYTDYSPSALRRQYDSVEPFLTLALK